MTELERRLINANAQKDPSSLEDVYGAKVTEILREKKGYSQSRVEAIVNNYLDDPSDPKYLREMRMLQIARKESKTEARIQLGIT